MRAVVDIGSNSIKYLLDQPSTSVVPPMRSWTTSLGRGMGQTGLLQPASLEASERALEEMAAAFAQLPRWPELKAVATSAVRDSKNPEEMRERVKRILNVPLRILSGAEEARLSFEGAIQAAARCFPSELCLFVDIGGASTEVSYVDAGRDYHGHSFQAGAVRCFEGLHLGEEAVNDLTWARAQIDIATFFPQSPWESLMQNAPRFDRMVAVSGTLVAAAKVAKAKAHANVGYSLTLTQLKNLNDRLRQLSPLERVEKFQLDIGRADVLCAGILCVTHLMDRAGIENLLVTSWGLRHGILANWPQV